MYSPYITTKIQTSVILYPHQMDNKIYINLKKNLENQVVGKCFSKYGYVVKVINIINYKDGIIEAENTEAAANFDIEFSCRLCAPLKNKTIICQIFRINQLLITATNGPILVIITNDRLNNKVFIKNNNNKIMYKNGDKYKLLEPLEHIKVTINSIKFYDKDDQIKAIGYIEDIATEEEKVSFYQDQYSNDNKIVDFEEYMKEAESNKQNLE